MQERIVQPALALLLLYLSNTLYLLDNDFSFKTNYINRPGAEQIQLNKGVKEKVKETTV